jgi:hypothetical protein
MSRNGEGMAITALWQRFGAAISKAPHLTLAAFLGHQPSISAAKKLSLIFPKTTDFQIDPAYDPNIHKLDLDEESLKSKFLLMCLATWGPEALIRSVNACSLLQCMHHAGCSPHRKGLRNEAAFVLQDLIDAPTEARKKHAKELRRRCSEHYHQHEADPDSSSAQASWYQLGAPWFGLETYLGDMTAREDCGEKAPAPSNASWIARNTVWPERALDAAAHWSSFRLVRDVVSSTLIAWTIANSCDA